MRLIEEIMSDVEIIRYYDQQISVFDRDTLELLMEIPR
jgi:hypothetical protein